MQHNLSRETGMSPIGGTTSGPSMHAMIADYMENGFLENIIDMFKHDPGLYPLIGLVIRDERIRVRIGITALVEELMKSEPGHVSAAVPGLIETLADSNPVVRGDAANLLGIIRAPAAASALRTLLDDSDADVRWIARDAIDAIGTAD